MRKTHNCKQLMLASKKKLKPHVDDITAEIEEYRIFRADKTQTDRANVISSKYAYLQICAPLCASMGK